MGNISVSLPSDGETIDVADYNTPINTIVTEINGNLDNSNLSASAAIAGSKIADGGITAEKLTASAITLGYAQITSSFTTTSTSATLVTGLSTTVTIPAGGRRIEITAYSYATDTTSSGGYAFMSIWDGTVGSGTQLSLSAQRITSASSGSFHIVLASVVPAAGSKTYNVGFHVTAGTGTLAAAATYPAFILVKAI